MHVKLNLIELNKVHEVERPTYTELDSIGESNLESIEAPLRRFSRVLHQPDRYCGFLVWDGDPIELDENNEDSIIYMDALQRSNSKAWLGAMRSEMESMEINNVWTLVDLPKRIKPIGVAAYFDNEI